MDLLDAIKGRRSIRRFKPDPVPRSDIEKMVHAASLAPSGGNLQPWRFLAVTDSEIRDQMVTIIHDEGIAFFSSILEEVPPRLILPSLVFSKAPLVFVVLVAHFLLERDEFFSEFQRQHNIQGAAVERYGGFVSAQGGGAAIQNLLLTAYALGYGSCWLRIPYYAKDRLEEFLNVEKPWEILALVPVGIPDHSPTPPPRKPVDEILTYIE